ncbi:hypothetical protein ES703_35134 [subsurface metagenome]
MAKDNVLSWVTIKGYLKSIGMISDVDTQRTKEIFSQGKFLCPEELKAIFISNYKETDGKDQFKDLWLFSDNYLIEVLNFTKKETFELEITIFSNNIQSVSIELYNLDFSQKPKDDSRLHILFYTLNDFSCDQISTGLNCDVLKSIYIKYIKPNLVRGASSGLH